MMKLGAMDYLVKDALFLDTLGEVVALALRHIATERSLAEAQASLRRAEEDLARARKVESLGLMAGGIAHDFNNLFQALRSNLELALLKAPDAPLRAPLDRALKILDKASLLTHRMLEYSGRSMRATQALDLNPLVEECLAALGGTGGRPVEFSGQAGLPPIEGDGKQLAQVILGLLQNAVESLEPGGAVRVRTGPGLAETGGLWVHPPPAGPAVRLSIEDDGAGMAPEILERAFDPFFTTRTTGRGLGLAAALGILSAHGAGLWVRTAPGRGTTFRIHFPTA